MLVVATLVQNLVKDNEPEPAPVELEMGSRRVVSLRAGGGAAAAFLEHNPGLYPGGVGSGAARVWLFPHADGAIDNTLLWVVAMAVAGCLLQDPNRGGNPHCANHDAGRYGNRPGAGATHHYRRRSVKPSLIMLRKSFPAKALWLTAAGGVAAIVSALR